MVRCILTTARFTQARSACSARAWGICTEGARVFGSLWRGQDLLYAQTRIFLAIHVQTSWRCRGQVCQLWPCESSFYRRGCSVTFTTHQRVVLWMVGGLDAKIAGYYARNSTLSTDSRALLEVGWICGVSDQIIKAYGSCIFAMRSGKVSMGVVRKCWQTRARSSGVNSGLSWLQFNYHRRTPRDHLWADGLVERLVQTMKESLRKYCICKELRQWDELLPYVLLGYWVSVQVSLAGMGPYVLLFGRNPCCPTLRLTLGHN